MAAVKPTVKPVVRAAKKTAAPKPAVTELSFEADVVKETPGAFNFKEDNEPGTEAVSGGIYVRKAHLNGGTPQRVRVTIEIIG